MDKKHVVFAALEVYRRHCQGTSNHISERFQRERRSGRDDLDASIQFLRPMDQMPTMERRCLLADFLQPEWWEWSNRKRVAAANAIDWLHERNPPEIVARMEVVAGWV